MGAFGKGGRARLTAAPALGHRFHALLHAEFWHPELLAETRKFLANVDAEIGPLSASIKGAGDAAQGTLRTVDRAVDGDSRLGYEALRTLRDVADAARSLKALADYLERHPDALLRGKGGPDSK